MRILLILAALAWGTNVSAQNMTVNRLDSLVKANCSDVSREANRLTFQVQQAYMIMITDENANRMRVVIPIAEEKNVSKKQLKACMEANFHSALDVKYSLSAGYLWVIFVHPLKELQDDQFVDALMQVYTAAMTYGGSYSSTDVVFPGAE